MLEGLLQVDDTFTLDEFSCDYDKSERKLIVNFSAHNADGEEVEGNDVWQD